MGLQLIQQWLGRLDQAVLNVFLGTARSWSIPDSLFIGETVGGEMEPGITGNMHRSGRAVHDIVRDYSTTAAGTGPHVQQLRAVAPLQHLLSANSGKLANDLALLAQFFQGDADSMASAAQLANAVISCVHILFVTLMYVVVFRRVVNSLLQEVSPAVFGAVRTCLDGCSVTGRPHRVFAHGYSRSNGGRAELEQVFRAAGPAGVR